MGPDAYLITALLSSSIVGVLILASRSLIRADPHPRKSRIHQITLALLVFWSAFLILSLVSPGILLVFSTTGLLIYLLHVSSRKSARKHRSEKIQRDLPTFLDALVLQVEGGHAIIPAILNIRLLFPPGSPLRQEIERLKTEIEVGASFVDSLENLRERIAVPKMESSLGAIIQALRLGTPVVRVLREQSSRVRESLYIEGEEFANTLSVKLLIPLLFFIFPASFLVILSPVVVSLIENSPW